MPWKAGEIRRGIFRDLNDKVPMTLMLAENIGDDEWRTRVIDAKGTFWQGEMGAQLYVEEKNSPNTQVMVLVAAGSPGSHATTVDGYKNQPPGMGWPFRDDWDNLPDA